jgi:outer membrane receptor protein involved in Fe transport
MIKNLLFYLLFLSFCTQIFAQDSLSTVLKPDVKELLQAKIEVNQEEVISTGGFKEATLREAAGIMSVISAETIRNTAARDIKELLLTVAGIDFVAETADNVVTSMVRGQTGATGGLLMMINGIQMNDLAYSAYIFVNRIPLDHIERIEIIRGAGSVIYGGSASLAVVNVITKKYEQGFGTTASVQSGISDGNLSRTNLYFSTAQKYNNKVEISLSAFQGFNKQSNAREQILVDSTEKTINYADSAIGRTTNLSFGLRYKDLKINLMYDYFQNKINSDIGTTIHSGLYAMVENTFKISSKLSFTPTYTLRVQEPWNYINSPVGVIYSFNSYRNSLSGIFRYQARQNLAITVGTTFFDDVLQAQSPLSIFANGTGRVNLYNIALLGEMVYQSKYGNLIVGARLDKYNTSNPIFIPRFAYTKIFKSFHVKTLYSFAFRNPTTAEAGIATKPLQPEKTQSVEVEVGYKWRDRLTITANIFNIIISDAIKFSYVNDSSNYFNQGSSGTNGAEIELKYQKKKLFFRSNYSYYVPNYSGLGLASLFFAVPTAEQSEDILIPDNKSQFLGVPNHKFTAQLGYQWTSKFNSQITLITHSSNAVVRINSVENMPASYMLNLNLCYRNFLVKGFTIEAGVYNLLDQRTVISAYAIGEDNYSIREHNREFIAKLKYSL